MHLQHNQIRMTSSPAEILPISECFIGSCHNSAGQPTEITVDGMCMVIWSVVMKLLKKSKMITAAMTGFLVLGCMVALQPTLANVTVKVEEGYWHHPHYRYEHVYRPYMHRYWSHGYYDNYGFWHPGHWVRRWG